MPRGKQKGAECRNRLAEALAEKMQANGFASATANTKGDVIVTDPREQQEWRTMIDSFRNKLT